MFDTYMQITIEAMIIVFDLKYINRKLKKNSKHGNKQCTCTCESNYIHRHYMVMTIIQFWKNNDEVCCEKNPSGKKL